MENTDHCGAGGAYMPILDAPPWCSWITHSHRRPGRDVFAPPCAV